MVRKSLPFAALSVVGLVLVSTPGVKGHGGDATIVHGCLNPAGQVRIVEPDETCRVRETAVHWSGGAATSPTIVTGSATVDFDMPRGGMASATVSFPSPFGEAPVVMLTSTVVLRDVVMSVGSKTASGFDVVLALSNNSSAGRISGTHTLDWMAVGS